MIEWDPDNITRGLRFAAKAHGDQRVPGVDNLPYLLHVTQVATEIFGALQAEPTEDGELSILCAILHDTIEDTAITKQAVSEEFGPAVASGVEALSKDIALPYHEQMDDSLSRIREQPMAVWKVKLADRITNLQPPPVHWSREKALGYQEEARVILDKLGDASPVLAQRLDSRIKLYSDLIPEEP